MKGALIEISGNWAHFRKPETNNNPLTHDFITKTAFIGMIGAVLGIERRPDMRQLFPRFSNALLYGVQILNPIKKESWAFKLRYADRPFTQGNTRPVQMEFLKNPRFKVGLALCDESDHEVAEKINDFVDAVEANEARFTPVLGLHNCPANLRFLMRGDFTQASDEFVTKSFVILPDEEHKDGHKISRAGYRSFRIGVDRVPTHQNDDWWNEEKRYRRVAYPSEGNCITAIGVYYEFSGDESRWALL